MKITENYKNDIIIYVSTAKNTCSRAHYLFKINKIQIILNRAQTYI